VPGFYASYYPHPLLLLRQVYALLRTCLLPSFMSPPSTFWTCVRWWAHTCGLYAAIMINKTAGRSLEQEQLPLVHGQACLSTPLPCYTEQPPLPPLPPLSHASLSPDPTNARSSTHARPPAPAPTTFTGHGHGCRLRWLDTAAPTAPCAGCAWATHHSHTLPTPALVLTSHPGCLPPLKAIIHLFLY